MNVLGVSAYFHDSAAALVVDGEVVAAAAEERFTRIKHDAELPHQAIRYCLDAAGLIAGELDAVVFYEKPLVKLDRILTSHLATFPRSLSAFVSAMPVWGKKKLVVGKHLAEALYAPAPVLYADHHASHAAEAFFTSPFDRAALLTVDGVGEWATTTIGMAEGTTVRLDREIRFPHSLGLFYSAVTKHLGFKVNEDEWKVMALGAYGKPSMTDRIARLLHLHDDGSFQLAMEYFGHHRDPRVLFNDRALALLGVPPRDPEEELDERHFDLAASAQLIFEEAMLRLVRSVHERYRCDDLCLAGGVALNCLANGRLAAEGPFRRIHVPPAPGDDGGAIGAAMLATHADGRPRERRPFTPYLGPAADAAEVRRLLARAAYAEELDEATLIERAADALAAGRVIGWFQGRMEFGPRALGNRSILASPAAAETKTRINSMIKKREWFRPLAPSVLQEHAWEWFDGAAPSPYMSFVARARRTDSIPAVVHVDGTARLQTVREEDNPMFATLIESFRRMTGLPLVLNTSLNGPGEPIACSPEDALRTATAIGLDELYLGRHRLVLDAQAPGLAAAAGGR